LFTIFTEPTLTKAGFICRHVGKLVTKTYLFVRMSTLLAGSVNQFNIQHYLISVSFETAVNQNTYMFF